MQQNESSEMYLETIYRLELNNSHVHVVEISNILQVTKPSVNKAMNLLKKQNLITQEKYGPIMLTEKGQELGRTIYEKHKMITNFLKKSLGVNSKTAEDNACRIEHILSEEIIKAIRIYIKNSEIE